MEYEKGLIEIDEMLNHLPKEKLNKILEDYEKNYKLFFIIKFYLSQLLYCNSIFFIVKYIIYWYRNEVILNGKVKNI